MQAKVQSRSGEARTIGWSRHGCAAEAVGAPGGGGLAGRRAQAARGPLEEGGVEGGARAVALREAGLKGRTMWDRSESQ